MSYKQQGMKAGEKVEERLIFRLTRSDKQAFMAKVEREGKKTSEVLINLVRQYISEPEQSSEIEEIKRRLEILEERLMGESVA